VIRVGRNDEPRAGTEDLIVPLPPTAASAWRSRTGEPFRSNDCTGKRWREDDLPALGWRYREPYTIRSTFITLACKNGADHDRRPWRFRSSV
jgi:hypothetical protein